MIDLKGALEKVHGKITLAVDAAQGDTAASPVMVAVVREFVKKAEKAMMLVDQGSGNAAVIELEQAGDSAKAAVEADTGAAEETTAKVLDAQLAICMLKASLDK